MISLKSVEDYHQQLISEDDPWPVWHTWFLLTVACLALFLVNYLKSGMVFKQLILALSTGINAPDLISFFLQGHYVRLWICLWWSLIHILGFIALPCLAMRLIKEPLTGLGFGWNKLTKHFFWYIALSSMIMVFAFFASYRADFQHTYPFYPEASRSGFDWLAWAILYAVQFIAVEFFFRGFLVLRFQKSFGLNVLWLMCLPYLMLHFSKPWLESFGAFGFGILLGLLSLASRSIWGGVFTHVTIATAMDALSLWQKNALPNFFWPQQFVM